MSVKDRFWVTGLPGQHKHSHVYCVLPLNCNNVATYQLTTPNISVTWPLACRVIPAPSFSCMYWHSLRVTGWGFWKPSGGALRAPAMITLPFEAWATLTSSNRGQSGRLLNVPPNTYCDDTELKWLTESVFFFFFFVITLTWIDWHENFL